MIFLEDNNMKMIACPVCHNMKPAKEMHYVDRNSLMPVCGDCI